MVIKSIRKSVDIVNILQFIVKVVTYGHTQDKKLQDKKLQVLLIVK